MLRPLIEERFDYFARKKKDPSLVKNEPNDMITWLARAVTDSPVSGTIAYEEVAIHYMFLSIAAIQTSMASSTHFFLDLMSSPPELGYYERIREEAAAVFKTEEDWGSSASVTKLTLVDSALRESLRKNVQLTRGLMREVMPKDGINLPDGRNLPQGTWLGIAVQGVHSDNRFYSNPDKFEPFRFAKMDPVSTETQKTPITGNDGINTGKGSSERKNVQLSTTSDIFLGFGYGRTAW
ncbi:hypothetical protein MMC07_001446 [Pseudocyphellaria aurata]|nr:hypothetical protein [Pseudocyphellaria aurata]